MTWTEIVKLGAVLITIVTATGTATWKMRAYLGQVWGELQGLRGEVKTLNGQVAENTTFRQSHSEGDIRHGEAIARIETQVAELKERMVEGMARLEHQFDTAEFVLGDAKVGPGTAGGE